jgi:spore coat polysaccharide biosynthesis protein SpsF (cytidylyltransferase family)
MLIGFVIQARTGSTRLPKKVVRHFYNSCNILELIIDRIKKSYPSIPVILATTIAEQDNILVDIANKKDINYFRGSESNVLSRFIEVGEEYKFEYIIRVCADNPFLYTKSFVELIEKARVTNADYIGFEVSGVPSIKSHFGFWGEVVKLSALKQVAARTNESLYLEHVTNYVYSNPDLFKIELLKIQSEVAERRDVRLTIDTEQDFLNSKVLYSHLHENKIPLIPEIIIDQIDLFTDMKQSMLDQITINSK